MNDVIKDARERARIRREIRKTDDRIADQLDTLCDMIERLRAEVEELTRSRNNIIKETGKIILDLRAERDRLRAEAEQWKRQAVQDANIIEKLRAEVADLTGRLAKSCDEGRGDPEYPVCSRASKAEADRERLRAEVAEARQTIQRTHEAGFELKAECDRLLELLREALDHLDAEEGASARLLRRKIDAALAKENKE